MSSIAPSTAVQTTPGPEGPANNISAGTHDDRQGVEKDSTLTINDVESLKKGIIKTSQNSVQAPYTILLVGETGVGKSAVIEFIANVLIGNNIDNYDFGILDRNNEASGSRDQSQTTLARFYKFTSKNNIVVRILDTPGLADARGIEQDKLHKKSISTEIQKHIDSVTAVLVLAHGNVQRLTVGIDYTLSTLAAMFPESLANNIAFVFTHVPSPLSWKLSKDTIPESLRDVDQFRLDNPFALQKDYIELKSGSTEKEVRVVPPTPAQAEDTALEVLVKLFNWLDSRVPQPTTEIVYLYNLSQSIEARITNALAQMDQAATKKAKIDELMNNSKDTDVIRNVEDTITTADWKQQHSTTSNMICGQINCYSNCEIEYKSKIPLDLQGHFGSLCGTCNHDLWHHHRCHYKWEKVTDTQVSEKSMKEWEAAKDWADKTAILEAIRGQALRDLNRIINTATNDLVQQVERYARLSLSWSFSAQVASAVRLLEQSYVGLEQKSIGQDQLQNVKNSLSRMEKKLELLNSAGAKARKETVEIGAAPQ